MSVNGKGLNKKEYKEMLDDICAGYCDKGHYCLLKEFLVSFHSSPRLLMQMKCVDKFKYEMAKQSKKDVKDIGWSEAMNEWVEQGYAKKFAEKYKEGVKFNEIYKKIVCSD